jgi:hypothetical protein
LKTHEKNRGKDDKAKGAKKDLNFIASADLYPSGGSSSEETDSMLFDNVNMLQFEIVDGNNIKYSSPVLLNNIVDPNLTPSSIISPITNEAIQLQMANEVEIGSPWVDISVLASKSVEPTMPVTSSCIALSTAIPTYVDLPTYQVPSEMMQSLYSNDDQTMQELNELLMTNDFDGEGKTLKSITADAGICQCTNCKCDPMEGGCIGGCGPKNPCRRPNKIAEPKQIEIDTKQLIEEIDSLNVDTTKPSLPAASCDCKDTNDAVDKGCCVVICLKTLETIKSSKEHGCAEQKQEIVTENFHNFGI